MDSSGTQATSAATRITTNGGNWSTVAAAATPPVVQVNTSSVSPSNGATISFTGTATDTGTCGNTTCPNDAVTSVTYAVTRPSGSTVIGWTSCTPNDGSFNETIENFTCSITFPGPTSQGGDILNILVRGTDAGGGTSTPASSTAGEPVAAPGLARDLTGRSGARMECQRCCPGHAARLP